MKSVVFLCDGMADYPVEALGGKTPLDVSNHPNLDAIARNGVFGLAQTVPNGMKPGSDNANLSVFGYDPLVYYTGRSHHSERRRRSLSLQHRHPVGLGQHRGLRHGRLQRR